MMPITDSAAYNQSGMGGLLGAEAGTYAAALLMAVGAAVALIGLRREWDGIRRPLRDPAKVLTWYRGFRLSIIGLALLGIGAAWLWELTWLLVLSLAIGGEETLESSIFVFALTKGKDLRLGPRVEPRIRT